jgi:hypothetical protein
MPDEHARQPQTPTEEDLGDEELDRTAGAGWKWEWSGSGSYRDSYYYDRDYYNYYYESGR